MKTLYYVFCYACWVAACYLILSKEIPLAMRNDWIGVGWFSFLFLFDIPYLIGCIWAINYGASQLFNTPTNTKGTQ